MTIATLKKLLAKEIAEALDIAIECGGDIERERALKTIAKVRAAAGLANDIKLTKVLDHIATKISAGR